MSQQTSIGRIVHYRSYGTPGGEYLPETRAAVITAVLDCDPDTGGFNVHLAVLNPEGMFFNKDVPYSEHPEPGHWSWPPRT